jgi:hypothetical protein
VKPFAFTRAQESRRPNKLGSVEKLRTRRRKFVVDSCASAIFWGVVYLPIFIYTSRTVELVAIGLATSTLVEAFFGGFYGKFLDWFRIRLKA